jgi:hypothetical protein
MRTIDLQKDGKRFREELEAKVASLAANPNSSQPISALEIGYDCNQGGWIFIHDDRRSPHERDGEWTLKIDDDNVIDYSYWAVAIEASFEGEDISVIKFDGSKFVIPATDLDSEDDEIYDEETDVGSLPVAIGEMIHGVLMLAKADECFAELGEPGTIQLDIEDFNGEWGWPAYEELGVTNLA